MLTEQPEGTVPEDPHAQMERAFMEAYLHEHELSLHALLRLPETEARKWMTEASRYASAHLSEVECRARMVAEVHGVAPTA